MPRNFIPNVPTLRNKRHTRIIKKYQNRRLYDTDASCYITLAQIRQLVIDAQPLKCVDAKTGEDLTRNILLQIILEEEINGVPMFSEEMLSQLIVFHGLAMQGFMAAYLEKNIQTLSEFQSLVAVRAEQLRSEFSRGEAIKPDAWLQFMGLQSPLMKSLMDKYLEDSKTLFVQMQQQLVEQTEKTFSIFNMKQP